MGYLFQNHPVTELSLRLNYHPSINTAKANIIIFLILHFYIPVRTERKHLNKKAFAALSGEENTIATFKNNKDIHQSTASKVFNVLYNM